MSNKGIFFNKKDLLILDCASSLSSEDSSCFIEERGQYQGYSEKLFVSLLFIENFFLKLNPKSIWINSVSIQIDFSFENEIKLKEIQKILKQAKNSNEFKIKAPNLKNILFAFFFKDWLQNIFPKNIVFSESIDTNIWKNYIFSNLSSYQDKNDKKLLRLEIKKEKIEKFNSKDHRFLNKELDFFWFSNKAGPGFPFWTNNGQIFKEEMKRFIFDFEKKENFYFVSSPILGRKELYEKSGHLKHYEDFIFPEIKLENESFILRPMTCPHHCLLFNSKRRKNTDLPIRMSENSLLFRRESSGSLSGIERTRQMELKDTHIFVERDVEKIKEEIKKAISSCFYVLERLGIRIKTIYLSLHDSKNPKKYFDDNQLWLKTETILKDVLESMKIKFVSLPGEAAFYGPKIDFQIDNAQQKDITISTIQLDFLLGEKFNLSYESEDSKGLKSRNTPIIIHHGIFGTYERLLSILLEKNNGWLPFFLSPIQVAFFLTKDNPKTKNFLKKVSDFVSEYNFRIKIFEFKNNLSSNLKKAWSNKIPIHVFIGDLEVNLNKITIKQANNKESEQLKMSLFEFVNYLNKLKK